MEGHAASSIDDAELGPGGLDHVTAGEVLLEPGDRLTHWLDKPLRKPADLLWQMSVVKPGDKVTLKVQGKNGAKEVSFPAGEGL